MRESEYTTDVVFATAADLAAIYPRLLHHAIEHFQTGDVLRFLGWVHPNRLSPLGHRVMTTALALRDTDIALLAA